MAFMVVAPMTHAGADTLDLVVDALMARVWAVSMALVGSVHIHGSFGG
jgi:hypothetical protein